MNWEFWAGLWGTVESQLVCSGPEPPDEAPIHSLAFCTVSKQSPAFVLSRPAMWQCVGVAALRNTDPGLQGQDESLVEDLGLGRPESLLMESWNSLAPGCQPALFPAVWGQVKLHQAECLVLALPQASSLQDLGVLAGISSEQRTWHKHVQTAITHLQVSGGRPTALLSRTKLRGVVQALLMAQGTHTAVFPLHLPENEVY